MLKLLQYCNYIIIVMQIKLMLLLLLFWPTMENIFSGLITFSKYLGLLLQLVIFTEFITFCKHENNNILLRKGFKQDKRKFEPCNWKQGSYTFLNKKFKNFSRTFKNTFPIFQGLHSVQKRASSLCLFQFFQNMSNFVLKVFPCLLLLVT